MKLVKIPTTILATLLVSSAGYSQENGVVLNYNQITVGYMHHSVDVGDDDISGNGVGVGASGRFGNFVISFGLGNSWIEDTDTSLLQIGGGIGYIFELSDSLHLVPGVSLDFERLHDFEYYYAESWVVTPQLQLNYAATDKLELSIGVGYSEPFNTEVLGEDASQYVSGGFGGSLGSEYAIGEKMGLLGGIAFGKDQTVFVVGISLHF